MALLVTLGVCITAGLVHAVAGWASNGGLALQIHVAAGVCVAVLMLPHIRRHPQRPRPVDLSRRTAVRALAVGGGAAVAYAATRGTAAALTLPGGAARVTGSTDVGTGNPTRMPVTQWFLDGVPKVDPDSWQLVVRWPGGGQTWSYADLVHAADDEVQAIIDCTGGWYAAQRWTGIWLDRLLPQTAAGNSISVVSLTGYERRLPRTDAPRLLIATHVAGQPLSSGHGAPARLVAPGRRGFWWVKWIHRVELDDRPWWLQPPLPLR